MFRIMTRPRKHVSPLLKYTSVHLVRMLSKRGPVTASGEEKGGSLRFICVLIHSPHCLLLSSATDKSSLGEDAQKLRPMQNTKTSLWTVSQMDGPCDFPFSLLVDKLFPPGQYKQTNLFRPEQASQTWVVFFLFFPSVGKEKVYFQPKEKKARTKLCLLCVGSQSSRCFELSA